MYSLENRYAMLKKVLEQQGILNVDEYLTPPQMIPPPQPDPLQMMQTEMAAKQLELQERQTSVAEMRAQADLAQAQAKMQLDAEKAAASHALQSDNMDLKEAQFEHKQRIDEAELAVLRNAEDVRGIASPTG
jgi:multidrug efflux pump subunit AcrA (membrane-fusion protein)